MKAQEAPFERTMNNHTTITNLLKKIIPSTKENDNFYAAGSISCPKTFVHFMGDFKGGFILNQLVYWSDKKTADPDGWMYKSYEEWQKELPNISKYIIYSRTEWLKELGILKTCEKALPDTNDKLKCNKIKHYKFDFETFMEIFSHWIKGNVLLSPHEREKFDHLSSKIRPLQVKNSTTTSQIFDAPNEDTSLYTEEYHAVKYEQNNTNTPPSPPMEQKPPDKEENEAVINPNEIAQRMQWLDMLGIQSNEWRHKIASTCDHERFNWAIETYNSYLENKVQPPEGGVYAKYLLNLPDKHGNPIKLWKYKPKSKNSLSPELTQAIAQSCQQTTIIPVCNEWEAVKIRLQQNMTRATYNTWIPDLKAEKQDENHFIIHANKYALDWLENKLRNTIERTFEQILMTNKITLEFKLKE